MSSEVEVLNAHTRTATLGGTLRSAVLVFVLGLAVLAGTARVVEVSISDELLPPGGVLTSFSGGALLSFAGVEIRSF